MRRLLGNRGIGNPARRVRGDLIVGVSEPDLLLEETFDRRRVVMYHSGEFSCVTVIARSDARTSAAGLACASSETHLATSSQTKPMHRKPETAPMRQGNS